MTYKEMIDDMYSEFYSWHSIELQMSGGGNEVFNAGVETLMKLSLLNQSYDMIYTQLASQPIRSDSTSPGIRRLHGLILRLRTKYPSDLLSEFYKNTLDALDLHNPDVRKKELRILMQTFPIMLFIPTLQSVLYEIQQGSPAS